jgi:ABC-type polysaccharide/polyol phosphate export permease
VNFVKRIWNLKIKKISSQIVAITEKELRIRFRWRYNGIQPILLPLLNILMPLITMGFIFSNSPDVGYWNAQNYGVFIILGFEIGQLKSVMDNIPMIIMREKNTRNLAGLMIAPINHLTMLFGFMVSTLLVSSIPIGIFLVISWFLYPCSAFTLLTILVIFFLLSIIFMASGMILCAFVMAKESLYGVLTLGTYFLFWLSAMNYPLQIFPIILQFFIKLNPFYYFFDLIRLTWIENSLIVTITAQWLNVVLLVGFAIGLPFIALYFFEFIFKKYGIQF